MATKITKPELEIDEKSENVKLAIIKQNDVSKWLIHRYKLTWFNDNLWSRKDKVYEIVKKEKIKSWIKADFDLLSDRQIEIIFSNCLNYLNYEDDYNMDTFKDLVYFRNGIYNLKKEEFSPMKIEELGFSPNVMDHNFVIHTPAKLAEKKFKNLNKFLNIYGSSDEELIIFFLEIFGSALTMRTPFSSFFVFFGEGNTGKSTLNKFIRKIFSARNAQTFALKRLTNNQTSLAETMRFYGKTYVYDPDAADLKIKDMSEIKQLTGGDIVTGKYLYQNMVSFENVATIVVVTNHAPKISETGKSIDRRIGLFPLPRDIDDLPESKKVPFEELDDMMNDSEVQQQFIQLALTAFSQAVKRGHMTAPKKLEPYYKAFKIDNNDIYRWLIEEEIIQTIRDNNGYNHEELFDKFENWNMKEKNKKDWSRKGFTQLLNKTLKKEFDINAEATQSRVNGKVKRKYTIISKEDAIAMAAAK